MNDCAVLNIGKCANFDGVEVSTKYTVVPDRHLLKEVDIAYKDSAACNPSVWCESNNAIPQVDSLPLPEWMMWKQGKSQWEKIL